MSNKNVLVSIPGEKFELLSNLVKELRAKAASTSTVEKNQKIKQSFLEEGYTALRKGESQIAVESFLAKLSSSALASRLVVIGLETVLADPDKL